MNKEILPESLLKEAVRKACEIENNIYERETVQDEEHIFSEEYKRNINGLLHKKETDKSSDGMGSHINKRRKKISKRVKIVLIAAIIMLMASMTVLAVEPLREIVYRMVEQLFPDHTDVTFEEIGEERNPEENSFDPADYPKKLKYVPDGYTLIQEDDDTELFMLLQIYLNSTGNNLTYNQVALANTNGWLVTSNGENAEEISVGGEVGYYFTDEKNYHIIIVEKEGFAYKIGGYDNVDVLVKCLESVLEE